MLIQYYVFHRFGQAKFADGGSILGSNKFTQLPSKKMLDLKKGQNVLQNNQHASLI